MNKLFLILVKKITKLLEGTGIGKIKPLFRIYALLLSLLKPKIVMTEGSKIYILTNTKTKDKFTFATRSLSWPAGYGFGLTHKPN